MSKPEVFGIELDSIESFEMHDSEVQYRLEMLKSKLRPSIAMHFPPRTRVEYTFELRTDRYLGTEVSSCVIDPHWCLCAGQLSVPILPQGNPKVYSGWREALVAAEGVIA